MAKSPKRQLTAVNLRLILSLLIVVVVGLTILGFSAGSKLLKGYADDVAQATSQAAASKNTISRLQKTQADLAANRNAVQRAANIVADSTSYQYQNQIINDLNDYAQQSGVKLVSFSFDKGSATAPVSATPGTVASTPVTGVKSTTVTVQLGSTVPYVNLLQFIHSIEQNLTKMQVSKLSLAKASGGDPNMVAGQSLVIEVYVK